MWKRAAVPAQPAAAVAEQPRAVASQRPSTMPETALDRGARPRRARQDGQPRSCPWQAPRQASRHVGPRRSSRGRSAPRPGPAPLALPTPDLEVVQPRRRALRVPRCPPDRAPPAAGADGRLRRPRTPRPAHQMDEPQPGTPLGLRASDPRPGRAAGRAGTRPRHWLDRGPRAAPGRGLPRAPAPPHGLAQGGGTPQPPVAPIRRADRTPAIVPPEGRGHPCRCTESA